MQCSSMKSTMPLLYWTIAPGEGHALRQPGSEQCMQPSLRISHSSRLPSSTSEKRITVHDSDVRSGGLSYTPTFTPITSRRSFHSLHATWHALQPMHFEMSMSLATSTVLRIEGGGVVVAERCLRSRDCNDDMGASLRFLDGHDERLVLGGLCVCVPDEWRQRVGDVADPGHARVAPVNGDPDGVHLGAAAIEHFDPLGHADDCLDFAPVGPDLDRVAVAYAFFLRQLFADLDELLRLRDRIHLRVLGPEMEVLGQAISCRGIGEILGFAKRFQVPFEHSRR